MDTELTRNVEKTLKNNEYPGRGIIIGANTSGKKLIQVYWIMGRSPNSQNRIFVEEDNIIKTNPFDHSKVEDPSLIIYNALRTLGNKHIVSNGDQTDTVYKFLADNKTFEDGLATRTFEPDGPNFTPRISGMVVVESEKAWYKLNILKTIKNDPEKPVNTTWNYDKFINGTGHCFHTYKENGNPLPPYEGAPYPVPLLETIDEIADYYWNNLNDTTRISLVVKSIDLASADIECTIINKHK